MVGEFDYGKIGITDKGDFVPGTTVCEELDGVTYDNQYWISLDNNNSTTPSTNSNKWHRALNGKPADQAATAANNAASAANTAAGAANDAATLAETKAGLADTAAQEAHEAAEAAAAAVVVADLPAVATETAIRNIVRNYTPST